MKKSLFLLLVISLVAVRGHGQLFVHINSGLDSLAYSWAAWGDYDKDGDLDVVLAGQPGSTIPEMKIYRNDSGSFHDIHANLKGVSYSSAEWGDYDNDNDLDLLVTGLDSLGNPVTKIYRNDSGIFTDINANLPAVGDGQATWGDYNNDGRTDILLAGSMKARILRNDGNGQFTDIDAHLVNVESATVAWGDYDNDGQLDALVGGDTGSETITKLYHNDHGNFVEDSVGFIGLSSGKALWADLNNDGKPDLLINGNHSYVEGMFEIYQNMGNGQFTLIDNYNFNVDKSSVDVADYDNDGLLDIILTGQILGCGGTAVTMLYHNEGYFIFIDQSTLIPGTKNGSVQFGDYDNDGYPDLLFTGLDPFNAPVTSIWRNNQASHPFAENTPPDPPVSLTSTVSGSSVRLGWTRGKDDQTPKPGETFNLFVGTAPDSVNIVSPMSDIATGFRRIASKGNANADTVWTINDLAPGQYFWSVQAVDNGFLGSAFAPKQTFTVNAVGMEERKGFSVSISPNPVHDLLMVNLTTNGDYRLTVTDLSGKSILEKKFSRQTETLDVSGLPKGIYIIRICSEEKMLSAKFVRN